MNIDPARIFTLAGLVEQSVSAYYDDNELDLPGRRLVAPGLPAYDCPMLAVHVERMFPHDGNLGTELVPQNEGDAAFYVRGIVVAIYVLRCVPTLQGDGNPPAVDDEEYAASAIYEDPVHISKALVAALEADELPGCGALAWEGWESVTPEGALGGGVLRVRLSLE